MKKEIFFCIFSLIFLTSLFAQNEFLPEMGQKIESETIKLEFFNQKECDVLESIASIWCETVNIDSTINGVVSINFCDKTFESALERFCNFTGAFWHKENEVYYVSKIFIQVLDKPKSESSLKICIKAQDVLPEFLLKKLSGKTGLTIMNDAFPQGLISINKDQITITEVLEIFCLRFDGFEVENEKGIYFIRKKFTDMNLRKTDSRFTIKQKDDLYSVEIVRSNFNTVIYELFRKAGKEVALVNKNNVVLENIKFLNKNFETVFSMLLEISSCDFLEKENITFIFDIQARDASRSFKTIEMVNLKNICVTELVSLLPNELNITSVVKTNKNSNSIFLYGSSAEIKPILNFIKALDKKQNEKFYTTVVFNNIEVAKGIEMIPKSILLSQPVLIPNTSGFVILVDSEQEKELKNFVKMIDVPQNSMQVNLRYISGEEFLKFLPSKIDKNKVQITPDSNKIIFLGTKDQYEQLLECLEILDRPKKQIRYQLLVIQSQKSKNHNFAFNLKLGNGTKTENQGKIKTESSCVSGNLLNLFNVNFDVVSLFGLQAAVNFNMELGNSRAKILADTTLNGISGSDISFENKNIFRYRDIISDSKSTATCSSIVREISTGLVIKINGWVSGDEMISVKVNADLSKQGSSSNGNLPCTSEKKVSTNIQTKSGKPIVISGLLQNENDDNFSGSSKRGSSSSTELIIYLTPFLEKDNFENFNENEQVKRLYEKYVGL
ncbi:MAG: type II secretion system protein GspD [Treponemataceae bacterium]